MLHPNILKNFEKNKNTLIALSNHVEVVAEFNASTKPNYLNKSLALVRGAEHF